jgi:plasmid stability protein
MTSLTVRNLDEDTECGLRLRAARHGKPLEQEVCAILRRAAREDEEKRRRHDNLYSAIPYSAIRELVEPYGGFELEIPERSRPLPTID